MSDGTDLAWLAGFWDGEGSVGLVRNKETRVLVLQLSHTEIDSIREIFRILRKYGINGRGYTYQERDPAKHRDAHHLRITGIANCLKLGRLLLPFAVTKKRHFELAIEWAESRIEQAGGLDSKGHLFRGGIQKDRGYSKVEINLAEELSTLNRRGPDDRKRRKAKDYGRIDPLSV
jgi:hypothetical protein